MNEKSVFTEEDINQASELYINYTLNISYKHYNLDMDAFTILYRLGDDFEDNTLECKIHLDVGVDVKCKYTINYKTTGVYIDVLELYLYTYNTIYNMLIIDNIEKLGAITLSISDYKIFKIRG